MGSVITESQFINYFVLIHQSNLRGCCCWIEEKLNFNLTCWNHCGYCQAFTFSSFYDSITFWKFLAPFIQNVYLGAGEEKKTMKICRKSSKIVSGFLRNTMYAYSKYVPQAWIKLILYTLKMSAMSVISSIFHKCPDRLITSITAKPYILHHSICSNFY